MSVDSVAYIAPNQLDHKRTIRSCEEISGTLCRGDRGEIPVLPVRSKAGELCDESAKPEGLFCFGSEYPELAAAVAETGICGPVITDYPAMAASCGDGRSGNGNPRPHAGGRDPARLRSPGRADRTSRNAGNPPMLHPVASMERRVHRLTTTGRFRNDCPVTGNGGGNPGGKADRSCGIDGRSSWSRRTRSAVRFR